MQGINYSKRVYLRSFVTRSYAEFNDFVQLYTVMLRFLFLSVYLSLPQNSPISVALNCTLFGDTVLISFFLTVGLIKREEVMATALVLILCLSIPSEKLSSPPFLSGQFVANSCFCLWLNTLLSVTGNLPAQLEWSGCANILFLWTIECFMFSIFNLRSINLQHRTDCKRIKQNDAVRYITWPYVTKCHINTFIERLCSY